MRRARKNLVSDYLHIMVQGINREYIFNKKEEIQKYLKILKKNLIKYDVLIIAYCIMNNHAHFLVYSENKKEVSELMRVVNTTYAIYYNKKNNRVGFVFRNRYRAEEILTNAHLISCIKYIHQNPVKAGICNNMKNYEFSSYNDYLNGKGFINKERIKKYLEYNGIDIEKILENKYDCDKFIDVDCKNHKEKIDRVVNDFLKNKDVGIKEIKKNSSLLKELSRILYYDYNITQKEIGEIIGVNRLRVHRAIKS